MISHGETHDGVWIACCDHCHRVNTWVSPQSEVGAKVLAGGTADQASAPGKEQSAFMVYPPFAGPWPHEDMPEECRGDYLEARAIAAASPRGAAALLRLCIQKLCKQLDEKGANLNDDIANLVRKGLPVEIQQAMDIVRVTGNNAVHPGNIDVRDSPETVSLLFELLNHIVENRITQPRRIEQVYEKLPARAREAIIKRDAGKS